MTTETQKSETVLKWEKQWEDFFTDEITDIIEDAELHFFTQRDKLEALHYANSSIDVILEKFDEMRVIFGHLIESQHLLHYFLDDDFPYNFNSLSFDLEIDPNIEFKLEQTDSTEEELVVECMVSIEDEVLIFRMDEQTSTALEIKMISL